jgi:hypothetical protein
MRNVISVSDMPLDLHQWLKDEAERQSKETGKPVFMYQLLIRAAEEYRTHVEAQRAVPSPEPVGVTHG